MQRSAGFAPNEEELVIIFMCKQLLMGKFLALMVCLMAMTPFVQGQKGDNQFRLLAEAGIPTGEYPTAPGADKYRTGPGVYAKALYGVGRSGQLSLTAGFARFENATFRPHPVKTIPVLLGYKINIRSFYVEPQVGFGALNSHAFDGIERRWIRSSVGAAYYSLGAGYEYERIDFGIRFQNAHAVNNMPASWNSRYFQTVGIHIGYALWSSP